MTDAGRRLTFSEESFIRPETMETVALGCALRGALDVAALTKAYAALRREYPILGAQVEAVDDGFVFEERGREDASFVLARVTPWDFDDVVLPQLEAAQSLSQLQVDSAGDRHRVILWLSHAIADAGNAIFFFHRLWSLYTEAATTGEIGEVIAHPLPRPPHEVMTDRGFTPGDPPPYEERFSGLAWSGSMPSPRELAQVDLRSALIGRVRFGRDTSLELRSAASAAGVSVHSLVTAAIALAERSAFTGVPRDKEITLGVLTPVDFKARLTPPLHVTEVTTLTGFSPIRLTVTADSDLFGIGRHVSEQIKQDINSGLVYHAAINPMPAWASVGYSAPILISNIGAVPDLTLPPNLAAEDYRTYVCKNFSGLPALLASVPQGDVPPFPEASMYLVSSFGGRLSIEIRNMPGTVSPAGQEHILSKIRELLVGVLPSY